MGIWWTTGLHPELNVGQTPMISEDHSYVTQNSHLHWIAELVVQQLESFFLNYSKPIKNNISDISFREMQSHIEKGIFYPVFNHLPRDRFQKPFDKFWQFANQYYSSSIGRKMTIKEQELTIKIFYDRNVNFKGNHHSKFIDNIWEKVYYSNQENDNMICLTQIYPENNCAILVSDDQNKLVVPCDVATMLLWKKQNHKNHLNSKFLKCDNFDVFHGDKKVQANFNMAKMVQTIFNPNPNVPSLERFRTECVINKLVSFNENYESAMESHDSMMQMFKGHLQ